MYNQASGEWRSNQKHGIITLRYKCFFFFHMRCYFFWLTIYLVEILSNISLCVSVCVCVLAKLVEVQNEWTRTLSQRNVNVCRLTFTKTAYAY